jgi:outer membrane protein assembly factor BamB
MLSRRSRWLMTRLCLGAAIVALAGFGGVALLGKLGLERFQSDAARMAKLRTAPLLTIPSTPTCSNDWPQWRGPNRDGVSPESGLLTNWPPEGPRVLWRKPLDGGFSSLAVAEGRLYTMVQEAPLDRADAADSSPIHEAVVCWDAATGDELWRFRYPNQYDERFGAGPRSTPAVDDGHVYTVGPTGIFHCLRADTGTLVWRHDLLQEFGGSQPRYGMAFSPLVEGDLVYTMPGGPDGGAVAAFDKHDGRLVWKALSDPVGYSSPIAATLAGVRQVLFLTNTALVSLSPRDGRVLWRHPWETKDGFNIATPIVFGDYVFVSSAYGKGCTLLEVSAAADGSPRAAVVYEHNRMRNYFASSVLYEGHVYGFDNTSLACMDVRSGKIVWREADERKYKKGSFLIADGHLIVLGEYGRLALAAATPEGYCEKASFTVSRHKCWTVPVLAGGRLYVRDQSSLVCLDLKGN